jgi:predicted transcriptional regulator
MNRDEIKRRLDALAREYCATHNPNIVEELYRLARELEKMDKNEASSQR